MFALHFLALVFSDVLNHLFVLCTIHIGNFQYNILDKMLLKLAEKPCEKPK